jgi:hypothetical protein
LIVAAAVAVVAETIVEGKFVVGMIVEDKIAVDKIVAEHTIVEGKFVVEKMIVAVDKIVAEHMTVEGKFVVEKMIVETIVEGKFVVEKIVGKFVVEKIVGNFADKIVAEDMTVVEKIVGNFVDKIGWNSFDYEIVIADWVDPCKNLIAIDISKNSAKIGPWKRGNYWNNCVDSSYVFDYRIDFQSTENYGIDQDKEGVYYSSPDYCCILDGQKYLLDSAI